MRSYDPAVRRPVACAFVVMVAAVVAACGSARTQLPGVLVFSESRQFAVRPSFIVIPGDGSWVIGGKRGGGKGVTDVGRIEWLRWTAHQAVGVGVSWGRCLDFVGCQAVYKTDLKPQTFRLFAPTNGHFTRIAWQGESGGMRVQRFGSNYIWVNY